MRQQTDLPLSALLETMEDGVNARSVWDDVFAAFRFRTVLTAQQKHLFKKIFRVMAASPMQVRAFLRSLKTSMLSRPRVTRRFLEQVLPAEWFPRSLHVHAGWKDIAFILDYLRYVLIGVPSRRFQQQLKQYVLSDTISRPPVSTPGSSLRGWPSSKATVISV